jgi:hypothetical protein
MALGDAAEILICNRDRVVESVEQNGVGGFRPYAGQSQQALPQ